MQEYVDKLEYDKDDINYYVDNYNVYTDDYLENLDGEDYKYLK